MKRDAADSQDKGREWNGLDDPMLEGLPALQQALGDQFWDDGKARTPYTLKLSFVPGGCQVAIVDEVGRRTSYTNAQTVSVGLAMVESLIMSGGLPWRPWGNKR